MATLYTVQTHIKTNIKSWFRNIYYGFCKSNDIVYESSKATALADKVCIEIYDYYRNKSLVWKLNIWEDCSSKEKDLKDNGKCAYCGISQSKIEEFYNHVESNRFTRGKSFEIDRKVGRMKEYLDNNKKDSFKDDIFKIMENFSDNDISSIWNWFVNDYDNRHNFLHCADKEVFYLPAPYNKDNCVLACYWCNNAKTDAFTADEFKPIGKEIGKTIQKILNEHKPKGNI